MSLYYIWSIYDLKVNCDRLQVRTVNPKVMYETIKQKLQLISQKMESQKTLNYLIQKKEKREKDKLPKRQSPQ